MTISLSRYPGGKEKALTMSYDDGRIYDRQLVEIFNKYGIKGTFNLNSNTLGHENFVTKEEVKELYSGHEVAVHMLTHPFPEQLPQIEAIRQTVEDRKNLEELTGYIVRGMAYPFGRYNDEVISTLKSCGIEYSRTVGNGGTKLPEDFMKWHPTSHHQGDIFKLLDDFVNGYYNPMGILYIWGHSYEFPRVEGAWDRMEEFCKKAAEYKDKIWFATNIEIVDYVHAQRQIRFSADRTKAYNPTATDVWIAVDSNAVMIPSGKTVDLV